MTTQSDGSNGLDGGHAASGADPEVATGRVESWPSPDNPEAVPWALQLIARVERFEPPTETELCVAAGRAVVSLLADPRSAPGGEWEPDVSRWQGRRIRKIVRRARGANWERASGLPGVAVTVGRATVRALVPAPVRPLPPELDRLQVSGLDLEDAPLLDVEVEEGWPGVLVALSPTDRMSSGKKAAQTGHAAQLAWAGMEPGRRARWAQAGYVLLPLTPTEARWHELAETAQVVVHDAGFTEVGPGTMTALAWWR